MTASDPSPPVRRADELVQRLWAVSKQLRRRLLEHGGGTLTASQQAVVLLERLGPATVTTLARHEGVRSQSVGATVAELAQAGLGQARTTGARRCGRSPKPARRG